MMKNGGINLKIYVENEVLEYENNKNEIDNILYEIDNKISKSSNIFSHMIVDGSEVYESYYDYFLDNINVIEKVEVISCEYKKLVDNILVSTINYIGRIPTEIEHLANKFYREPGVEDWNSLSDLLDGISWIMNTFSSIDQDKRLNEVVTNYENWNLYAKEVFSLQELLIVFEEALSSNNNVSIADILSYEIVPIFNRMQERLLGLTTLEDVVEELN